MDVSKAWLGISSVVVAFSFVFGGGLKSLFDSIVFVFVLHPFTVGDLLKVGPQEDMYCVTKVNLMSTDMIRWDGARVRFLNTYLYNQPNLINLTRSGNFEVTVVVRFDLARLPTEQEIYRMRLEMEQFLRRFPGSFTGDCAIFANQLPFPLQVDLSFWWQFAYSDAHVARRCKDQSRVVNFIAGLLKKHGVQASGIAPGKSILGGAAI